MVVVDERAGALETAEEALGLAQVDPTRARRLALGVLHAGGPAAAGSVAERALGLAARELDDVPAATAHLARSVEIAAAGGLAVLEGQARMSLALTLAYAGRSEEALREADLAAPALAPLDRARLDMQRALILQRLGRLDEAFAGYRRAFRAARRLGDRHGEARVLMNRGVLQGYRGEVAAAVADLTRAADLFEQLGQVLYAAKARHNIGFVTARGGDVPTALRWYDRAEAEYRRLGVREAVGLLDRCEALLSVRLVPEAVSAAARAAAELEAGGMEADLAQARLLLAQAVLLDGRPAESARLAEQARRAFAGQRRAGWAAWAGYAWLRAARADGDRSVDLLDLARRTVGELAASGWAGPVVDARLITAEIALEGGAVEEAEAQLRVASRARRSGPADLRARAWHAEALLRLARGRRRGAETALRTGLRILSEHQATIGATDLRVHAGSRGQELAALGVRMAVETGRADRVLVWAERGRVGATRWHPVTPPRDAEVAASLVELRRVVRQLQEEGLEAGDQAPLLRRQAGIEDRIRAMTWQAGGAQAAAADIRFDLHRLRDALGDTALLELVHAEGELLAVVVAGGRASLHRLGRVAPVEAGVRALRFALHRLAGGRAPVSAAAGAFVAASESLDGRILGPLRPRLGDRALVVVPSGPAHTLPWSTLPSLRGRPVSVAPSAALWLRAASAEPGRRGATVLAAGPGLAHGDGEVTELARLHGRATTLCGSEATTARLLRAMGGAELVHVAAHGTFRADNPLFSCLRLADGPLTVYDLERLRRLPRRIVLSACDAGESVVTASNELMGVSSALLSLGARTLVAGVVPVSDEATKALMVELHRGLLRGRAPAEALAEASVALGDDDEVRARSGGFVCFGAG